MISAAAAFRARYCRAARMHAQPPHWPESARSPSRESWCRAALPELRPHRRIGTHQRRNRIGALRPGVGRRIVGIEQAERRDQRQPSHRAGPDRRDFGRERRSDRAAGEIGAVEPGGGEQPSHRQHPVELIVEHAVTERARITWKRRRDHGAAFGQAIEERNPARQSAKPSDEAELRAVALLPDPARKAVDLDRARMRWRARGPLAQGAAHSAAVA